MRKRQYLILVALVAMSGFIGGLVASRAFNAQPAMARENDEIVVAQELALVDANGDLKAMLSAKNSAPQITLYDQNGNARAMYSLTEAGEPSVVLQDAKIKAQIIMALPDEGGAAILMKDAAGKRVFRKP